MSNVRPATNTMKGPANTIGHYFVVDGDGRLRLPSNSSLFDQLCWTPGVQVRLAKPHVMSSRRSTVRRLIDQLSSHHQQILERSLTTSGTSTATFPGSDLLYGGADGGLPKMAHVDYLARTDVSNYEKERQRLRDLEIVNKRPSSKGGKRGSHPFVDNELTSDRERDDVRVLTGHTTVKLQPYKGPALTSSLVRGEPILAQRPNGSNSVRESEDLIAMGTLFTPTNYVTCNGVTRGSASSTTTASTKSNQYGGPQNSPQSGPPVTNNTPGRKTITFSMNSTKQTSNVNGMMTSQRQFGQNFNIKEDPKYPDPLVGATASYQQRLMELAALETETIRWERTKKVKKKT